MARYRYRVSVAREIVIEVRNPYDAQEARDLVMAEAEKNSKKVA